jgi:hypothetical protein
MWGVVRRVAGRYAGSKPSIRQLVEVLGLGCELAAVVGAGLAVAVVLERLAGAGGVEQAGAGSRDAFFELAAQQGGAVERSVELFELAAEGDDAVEVHGEGRTHSANLADEGRTHSANLAAVCGL